MKKKRRLNKLLTFTFILIIATILTNFIGYTGFMKVEEINTHKDHYELVLYTEGSMGVVSFKLKKDELIDFSSKPNKSNLLSVSNMVNNINIGEEYFFDVDIYKFPLSLVKGNRIRYMKDY